MERRKGTLDPELSALEKCNLITDGSSIPPSQREKVISLVEKMQMVIASRPTDKPFVFKLDDFEIGGKLGSGRFSNIFLVREKKSDFILALKSVDKEVIKKAGVESDFMKETLLHSKLSHPNIVQFFTVFDDLVNWYVLTEYVPCPNIKKYREAQKENRVKSSIVMKYTYQLSDALNYLHSLKIVHRDVKPENILLDVSGDIKLSNFGLAACCTCVFQTQSSSSIYVAPEIIENKKYDYKVDMWSLGVLVYELLCGEVPFLSKDIKFTLKKIQKGSISFPSYVESSAIELITVLLKYNPDERPDASQVMIHPWILY